MKTDNVPIAKLKMMQASIRCLTFGLLGLLPLIGVPFALAGLWASYSARRMERNFWNPAKPHRIIGLICAVLGALVWSCVDTIIIYNIVGSYLDGWNR
jgi:hypothetical protein